MNIWIDAQVFNLLWLHVEDTEFAHAEEIIGFEITLIPGQNDYANCAGRYVKYSTNAKLRGKYIYHNEEKTRIAFYDGGRWVLTTSNYLKTVVVNGAKGGFYASKIGTRPYCEGIWKPRYTVKKLTA